MPLRWCDGTHRAEHGNQLVCYALHGLPRLLPQGIDAAIGQDAPRSRCAAQAARRLDQRDPRSRLRRADGSRHSGRATAYVVPPVT
jgi:hypothetical protein